LRIRKAQSMFPEVCAEKALSSYRRFWTNLLKLCKFVKILEWLKDVLGTTNTNSTTNSRGRGVAGSRGRNWSQLVPIGYITSTWLHNFISLSLSLSLSLSHTHTRVHSTTCRMMRNARPGTWLKDVLVRALQKHTMWISASTFVDTITLLVLNRSWPWNKGCVCCKHAWGE
jgi:hypothetical protein